MNNAFALIEFGASHDECLYSQVLFFNKASIPVHLIVHEDLSDRVKDYPVESLFYLKTSRLNPLRIIQYLIRNGIKNIVINTCSGNDVRNMLLLMPGKVNITGILHNCQNINNRNSQRIISSRVKKYFVLNDYILKNMTVPEGITIQSMYPIYFDIPGQELNKPDDEIWICIPGSLETKRRDYEGLIDALEPENLKRIKFVLLGKTRIDSIDYSLIKAKLEKKKMLDRFIFFFDFVDLNTFHAYIKRSDIIMPLIHPAKKGHEAYKKFKISGSFNLAFAYKKPLLMELPWRSDEDFPATSLFYTLENLNDVIKEVLNASHVQIIKESYNTIEKLHFEYQSAQYLSLVQKGSAFPQSGS